MEGSASRTPESFTDPMDGHSARKEALNRGVKETKASGLPVKRAEHRWGIFPVTCILFAGHRAWTPLQGYSQRRSNSKSGNRLSRLALDGADALLSCQWDGKVAPDNGRDHGAAPSPAGETHARDPATDWQGGKKSGFSQQSVDS